MAQSPYERARGAGRDALRNAVLQVANDLLGLEGAGALTMRRIADQIGASTTVLYTVFDGKNGIIDAMYREGHERLRARLEALPRGGDSFARLAASGRVYRENALAEPAQYQLMFGNAVPGYLRTELAREAARASFDALAGAVRDCIVDGILTGDPQFISEILLAAAHGAVSLELSGHFDDPGLADERFAVLTAASVRPFMAERADAT
jgi:AcrR family transcriptional regulator